MKSKLTITLDQSRIAKLQRASLKLERSISDLVGEFADRLELNDEHESTDWIHELNGILDGKIEQKELDADPKLAYILGKGKHPN